MRTPAFPNDDFKVEGQRLNRKLQRVFSKVKERGTKIFPFSFCLFPYPFPFS
jgi:hypothetical protein